MNSKRLDILDVDDIKKLTGQYDLECVKRLKFVGTDQRKIKSVADIELCTNLTALILTNHNISNMSSIKYLINLVELDLSFNKLSVLDVSTLTSLKRLDLRGNLINTVDTLRCMSSISDSLQQLSLQDEGGSHSNPGIPLYSHLFKALRLNYYNGNLFLWQYTYYIVCVQDDYKSTVISILPNLVKLDGTHLLFEKKMDEYIASLTPSDEVKNFKVETESWYSAQLLRTSISQSYESIKERTEKSFTEIEKMLENVTQTSVQESDEPSKQRNKIKSK